MDPNYELLAKYFGGMSQKGPANADVAKFILLNSNQNTKLGPGAKATADNEPSLMGRIFDVLSRPNYAIANTVKDAFEGDASLDSLWQGLSGQKKTTFKDVLKGQGADDVTAGGLGFLLDVGLDPTTYVSGAGIAKAVKGLKGAKEVPEVTKAQEILSKGEPIFPESFGLPAKAEGEVPAAFLKTPEAPRNTLAPVEPGSVTVPRQLDIGLDLTSQPIKNEVDLLKPTKTASVGKGKKELPGQLGLKLPISADDVRPVQEALEEAPKVKNIADNMHTAKEEMVSSNLFSDGQLKDMDGFLKQFGKASSKAAGLTPAAAKATDQIINIALDAGKSAAQVAVEHNSRMIDDIISTGKQNNKTAEVLTRGLEKDHGKLPAWAATDNKATEFLMGRVATWWGQRDLRPFSLNAIGASSATAAARGKALDNLFTGLSEPQRAEVLNLARGVGVASSPQTEQVATQVRRMLDNLAGQAAGTSVITRAALDMDEVNKWMKQYGVGFTFNKDRGLTSTGEKFDHSKGSDWINSWKTAEIKDDPEKFLFKFQQAVEQATREKALFEELGERFGQKVPGGGFNNKIKGHPYLDGYYFPPDIAKQIPRVVKDWSIPAWSPKSPLVQHYDRIMSMWKSGVTIYRPSHHIRNYAGDIYLGWMDGVNTARPYMLAAKVQRTMKDAYVDLMNVDKLVEVGLRSRNYATPAPGAVLFRNKSGVPFTAEQIGAVAHQKGLLEHTRTLEDIIDLGDSGRKSILNVKPFGGKVQKFARGASELTSHNARLAHFIDKVAKSKGKNLDEIFEQASRRARKWHPTGLDLTDFEKKYMRRIIPFYSWIRKSVPLLLEGLVMNPGKVIVPSKFYEGVQQAEGMDTPGRDNPFPVDQMFPQWIRAQGLGPVSMPEGVLGPFSNQMPPGYVMAGVGLNPLADLMAQFEDPQKTVLSSLSPVAQIPMEVLRGEKNFTGEPILGPEAREGAFSQYIGEQIPVWSAAQNITGITPGLDETRKVEKSGNDARIEGLINWATAAGIRGTGPYEKQALYEKRAGTQANRRHLTADFLERFGK